MAHNCTQLWCKAGSRAVILYCFIYANTQDALPKNYSRDY